MSETRSAVTEAAAAGPGAATERAAAEPTAEEAVDAAVDALKALAHPVRLRMVQMLAEGGGELCVCHFEEAFDLTQPTISHHLKLLREAGLLDTRRDGTWVHHRIRPETMSELAGLLGRWVEEGADAAACCGVDGDAS